MGRKRQKRNATKANDEGDVSSKHALAVIIPLLTDTAASVDDSCSNYSRPTQTVSIIGSGASETYTAPSQQLNNEKKNMYLLHKRPQVFRHIYAIQVNSRYLKDGHHYLRKLKQ